MNANIHHKHCHHIPLMNTHNYYQLQAISDLHASFIRTTARNNFGTSSLILSGSLPETAPPPGQFHQDHCQKPPQHLQGSYWITARNNLSTSRAHIGSLPGTTLASPGLTLDHCRKPPWHLQRRPSNFNPGLVRTMI